MENCPTDHLMSTTIDTAPAPALTPHRPAMRYHGGKWRLAPWIIGHFPPHRIYVEPYGGAGSVLLRKPRCYSEIYNDLDGEVVNLFRQLRENPVQLAAEVMLTPYAREEYQAAFPPASTDIESARRLLVRSWMGFGSNAQQRAVKSGFRANAIRSYTVPAHDWANFPPAVLEIAERLRGVTIENQPALELMRKHDGADTLFYLDPPYPHSTRSNRMGSGSHLGYTHEMTDDDHLDLIAAAWGLSGMVVISGYRCSLYDDSLDGWHRVDKHAWADSSSRGAGCRTESLWINEAAWQSLNAESGR